MRNICLPRLGPIWDVDAFWYSDDPELTPCFEKTILIWMPCGIYLMLLPFDLCQMNFHIIVMSSICRLCRCRKICITVIFLTSLIRMLITGIQEYVSFEEIDKAEMFSMALMSLCFLISMVLAIVKGHFSTLQWMAIMFFAIFGLPELCSKIRYLKSPRSDYYISTLDTVVYIMQYLEFCTYLILLSIRRWHILMCPNVALKIKENSWPERTESLFSRLFYIYMWKPVLFGYKKILQLSDLWVLDECDRSEILCQQLEVQFDHVKSRYRIQPDRILLMTVIRMYWKDFLLVILFIIVRDAAVVILLFDVKFMIEMAMNENEPKWHRTVHIIILFLCKAVQNLCSNEYIMIKIGIRIKCSVSSFIVKKSLRLSPKSRQQFSPGDISNLISVDTEQFLEQGKRLFPIVTAPALITITCYMLYDAVGNACWPGTCIILIRIFLCWLNWKYYKKYFDRQMITQDERMSVLVEMFKIMRMVKLYAWEFVFQKSIDRIRKRELNALSKSHIFASINDLISLTTNPIALVVMFSTYVTVFGRTLTADVAFEIVLIHWFLSIFLDPLPTGICGAITILESFKRLSSFMAAEEIESYITETSDDSTAISIKSAEFTGDTSSSPILKNIDLQVKKGQLVAIIGQVGSGKSALLSAIAGELYKCNGIVSISGSLAYVPQQSWILNDTLKANILFNEPCNDQRYDLVINACALKPDLDCLPAGDMTEIGERGINLSGGQKQRVSLARAAYQNKDIYLLDDPLSAVDVHVQKQLFDDVIGPNGILHDKTRLMVTKVIPYLPQCDVIVVMQDGSIIDCGTYEAIFSKHIDLLNMVQPYQNEASKENAKQLNALDDISKRKARGKLFEKETTGTGNVAWSAYWLYFKSGFRLFMPYVFLALCAVSCYTTLFIWVQMWTDNYTDENHPSRSMLDTRELAVLGGIVALQFILSLAFITIYHFFKISASMMLHKLLLNSILRAPITFFDSTPIGRILNRFSQDIFVMDTKFPVYANSVFIYTLNCLNSIIPSIYALPILAAFTIPFAIIFFLIQRFYIKSATQLKRLEDLSKSPIYSRMQDLLEGPDSIRVYGKQAVFLNSLNTLMDTNASAKLHLHTTSRWLSANMDWLGTFIITFVLSFATFSQHISASMLGLSISAILSITESMKMLTLYACETETSAVALESIQEYLNLPQEADWIRVRQGSGTHELIQRLRHLISSVAIPKQASHLPMQRWPSNGQIEFIDYCLKYRPDLPFALDHLNIKILAGQKVAIVGRTGAGKTSLTVALFRLIEPAEGKILIDSIDISTLGLHELRKQITIMPQEPTIFSGTIRKNVDPFDEYSDEQILWALELSHLKTYVESLENGLNYKLEEGGSNFSVGQRQLLCLCRALLKRSQILMLDEATASTDLETDKLIQESIRTQFRESTVITIAHRLETIMDYDRIIVLSNGKIIEDGSVQYLLSQSCSHFRHLLICAGIIPDE